MKALKGDMITVFDWRNKNHFIVMTTENSFENEDGFIEVGIEFDNGDIHYAIWNNNKWESGEL